MNPNSTVALLVPCHNAGRFLPRLAESVKNMTVPFSQIICYDDGSTDDTVKVAQSLDWKIITPNLNRGVSYARNRLAEAVTSEWIHFHDADDRISPDYLEKLLSLADDYVDVVSCDADWITEIGENLVKAWRYDAKALSTTPASHLLNCPLGLNSSIIRRTLWTEIGGCNEQLAMWEDADVHFRLALHGARWRHLEKVLTYSLRNESSFSHDYKRNWACRLQVLDLYAHMPDINHLRPEIAQQLEIAARQLIKYGNVTAASQALMLNHQLGGNAPSSRHLFVRILKHFLSPIFVLRLQEKLRSR